MESHKVNVCPVRTVTYFPVVAYVSYWPDGTQIIKIVETSSSGRTTEATFGYEPDCYLTDEEIKEIWADHY